jgi:hypothetical protein
LPQAPCPPDCRIAENGLRHLAVEQDQVLSQAIKLAHMTLDRRHFIARQRLARVMEHKQWFHI